MQQRFNIYGGRRVFKDGTFYSLQQDQRCYSYCIAVFQRSDEVTWYPSIHRLCSRYEVPQSFFGYSGEESGYQNQI